MNFERSAIELCGIDVFGASTFGISTQHFSFFTTIHHHDELGLEALVIIPDGYLNTAQRRDFISNDLCLCSDWYWELGVRVPFMSLLCCKGVALGSLCFFYDINCQAIVRHLFTCPDAPYSRHRAATMYSVL